MAREVSGRRPGACRGRRSPTASPGSEARSARGVAGRCEQLVELPAQDPRRARANSARTSAGSYFALAPVGLPGAAPGLPQIRTCPFRHSALRPRVRNVRKSGGSGSQTRRRVAVAASSWSAAVFAAQVRAHKSSTRWKAPCFPPSEIPEINQTGGHWHRAQGCERGVRISLVSVHAPVTGRPAISRA